MAAVIKHLLIMKDDNGYGWTEVHYRQSESDNPNLQAQLTKLLTEVAPLRSVLLGKDQQIVGGRVSYPRDGVIASLPGEIFLPGSSQQISADESQSLACLFIDSGSSRKKVLHMRGFWRSVVEDGEYHPEGGAGWTTALGNWKTKLVDSQYGWPSRDATLSSKGVVSNYTVNENNTITFTVGGASIPVAQVGKVISVRFSRLNNGRSPLNTTLLVYVDSVTSLTTMQQIAAGPFTGRGRYSFRVTSFVGYNVLQKVSAGTRKPGKVLGRLPGRSAVKVKY